MVKNLAVSCRVVRVIYGKLRFFDDQFNNGNPHLFTKIFSIHFLAFTPSQVRGGLVVVNCLVVVNLIATNFIWGDATAIASPLTLDYLGDAIPLPNYLGGCHPPHPPSTTPLEGGVNRMRTYAHIL
jgi:hypothetical protein